MLKKIRIANYKSIGVEPVEFVFQKNITFQMLFGKNESGKTNILSSLALFARLFKDGLMYFKSATAESKPYYIFEFEIKSKIYTYEVEVDLEKRHIIKEMLYLEEVLMFGRNQHQLTTSEIFNNLFEAFDFSRLQTYLYDLKFDRKRLLLANLFSKDFTESAKTHFLFTIGNILNNITYLPIEDEITFYRVNETASYESIIKHFKDFYPDIDGLIYKDISFDDLRYEFNRHHYDYFMDMLIQYKIHQHDDVTFAHVFKRIYRIRGNSLDELSVQEVFVKTKSNIYYKANEISDGMRFLLLFLIVFLREDHQSIYLLDDFLNHLDYGKSLKLMRLIKENLSLKENKLIASINHIIYFDKLLFKLNEIIYVSKKDFTTMNYLSKMEIRSDKKILNLLLEDKLD